MIFGHYPSHHSSAALTQFSTQEHFSKQLKTRDTLLPSARKLLLNRCCALAILIGLNIATYVAVRFIATHF